MPRYGPTNQFTMPAPSKKLSRGERKTGQPTKVLRTAVAHVTVARKARARAHSIPWADHVLGGIQSRTTAKAWVTPNLYR